VEAPTAGSVILAGVLLKLGAYGMLRVLLPMFPLATIYFTPLVYTICAITIFYAAMSTIRQIDLKKIIAYSSIVHMAYVVLGLFSYNIVGMAGAYVLMVGHAFVSGGLFLAVGLLYDRYHTRLVFYYSSLFVYMPVFSFFFFFFTLGNISFPGTSNFIGEFLVLAGLTAHNPFAGALACLGIVFSAVYAIWLVNRIFFRSSYPTSITVYADVSRREFAALLPFAIAVLLLGL
jgi:NADH:ubiquinone oxidoreductase subunit 4 (subunit M)